MNRLLNPWHTLAALAMVGVLAACEPAPPTPKVTTPASSKGASVPSDTTAAAVQGMSADAALVAQSAANAGSLPSHAQPSSAASPLSELKQYVGAYPSDSNVSFLEQGALADRLKRMLGKDYSTLLNNLRTVSPLTEEQGRWFITGNRPHEGGKEAAAIVVDAAQNAVRVWMLHEGKVIEHLDPKEAKVPWPAEVQTMLNNQKSLPQG